MPRLILIYNPNSSKFCHVKKDVLDKKEKFFQGYDLSEYTIKQIGFENNVKNLQKELKDGDLCFALGGDATAAITANAILSSEKDATLAVLPYGNFNDLARTLGTMKLKDFGLSRRVADNTFSESISRFSSPETYIPDDPDRFARQGGSAGGPAYDVEGEKVRSQKGMSVRTRLKNLYPLEIYVDGNFWRYATCYVTIGMTAEAVELFDDPKFRKYMKKGHKSSWRSYLELAKWYFKNRKKKIFLPEFTINKKSVVKKASDYAAVNGKSMCRVMKGGDDFKRPNIFRSKALKTISFPRLFALMAKSILVRTPGDETKGDLLVFTKPATVELQAEGEYQTFQNIKTIEIKKGIRCLKTVTKN